MRPAGLPGRRGEVGTKVERKVGDRQMAERWRRGKGDREERDGRKGARVDMCRGGGEGGQVGGDREAGVGEAGSGLARDRVSEEGGPVLFGCTRSMQKFPGQSEPHHSRDPSRSSNNAESLTHRTIRELL